MHTYSLLASLFFIQINIIHTNICKQPFAFPNRASPFKSIAYSAGWTKLNNNQLQLMEAEQGFERRRARKVRVKVRTNRGVDFITAVKADATISDLANRALSIYMQLSEDGRVAGIKKQLTVSAVKQGIFYMPKSELVASLLNCDDEVEVVIIKAKPKYPNQLFQNQQLQQPIHKQTVPLPEPQLLVEPLQPLYQKQSPAVMRDVIVEEDREVTDKMSCLSKKQRKKEKKLEKQKLKQQARQKNLEAQKLVQKQTKQTNFIQKPQVKNDQPSESKTFKESELAQEGNPRKRLKFQKEQIVQKPAPLVIPSPKITFHNEPRLESPKFSLLNESSKKRWEGQVRKQSDEADKRAQLEKMLSPVMASKSPLIYQRSPSITLNDNSKAKEKDEFSNFTLTFRKLSEEKKMELKKDKKDEIPSPRKEEIKNSLKKDEDKEPIAIEPQQPIIQKAQTEKKEVEKRESPVIQKKAEPLKLKPTPSMIVVEQDDSDSQQNKKSNCPYVHHRQKELTQIQQKINQFYIYSDED